MRFKLHLNFPAYLGMTVISMALKQDTQQWLFFCYKSVNIVGIFLFQKSFMCFSFTISDLYYMNPLLYAPLGTALSITIALFVHYVRGRTFTECLRNFHENKKITLATQLFDNYYNKFLI